MATKTTATASYARAVQEALAKFREAVRELNNLDMEEKETRMWLERIINQEMRQ